MRDPFDSNLGLRYEDWQPCPSLDWYILSEEQPLQGGLCTQVAGPDMDLLRDLGDDLRASTTPWGLDIQHWHRFQSFEEESSPQRSAHQGKASMTRPKRDHVGATCRFVDAHILH